MGSTPLYMKIKSNLKEQIVSGGLRSGAKVPSINQLVEEYSVSPITALKALKELRRENYVINEQGKGYYVVQGKAEDAPFATYLTIGLLLRPYRKITPYDNFFNEVNSGIQNECLNNGFNLVLARGSQNFNNHINPLFSGLVEQAAELAKSVDGLILDERIPDECLRQIAAKIDKKMVLVGRQTEVAGVDSVVPNYHAAIIKALEWALRVGYSQFVFCLSHHHAETVSLNQQFAQQHLLGLGVARAKLHLLPDADLIPMLQGHQLFVELINGLRGKGKTLVFCANDSMARNFTECALENGFKLKDELGIMGQNGVGYATIARPHLATIKVDTYGLGVTAARRIVAQHSYDPAAKAEMLDCEFVFGDTL